MATMLKVVGGQVQQFAAGDTLSTVAPLVQNGGQWEQLQAGDVVGMVVTANYVAAAGPAQPKTLSPSMTFTKSVA